MNSNMGVFFSNGRKNLLKLAKAYPCPESFEGVSVCTHNIHSTRVCFHSFTTTLKRFVHRREREEAYLDKRLWSGVGKIHN